MLRFRLSRLAGFALALLIGALGACSSSPPPTMDTVKKLVAEDRTFDALATLIPLAQKGDPQAQYELAGFYHYGYVGANDFAKAMKWYRASARQGYADAMVGLAVMYLGGQGVTQDRREAFVWLNLAAQYMGDQHAVARIKAVRDEVGKNLTKDDIAFAKAETILLQPEGTSVQPNEAESIEHLPDQLTPVSTPVVSEPLQNVPPDTGPTSSLPSVPEIQLQNAPPAPPSPAPAAAATSTLPTTTAPASTTATTPVQPPAPATAEPQTPPPLQQVPASSAPATTPASPAPANSTSAPPVEPVPDF
ncbi:MAG TPA: hypothetical protein VMT54_19275 [Candidatus Cybelea sp.]|nr:hypothetical protein [Candidatus Cybelea sp.]